MAFHRIPFNNGGPGSSSQRRRPTTRQYNRSPHDGKDRHSRRPLRTGRPQSRAFVLPAGDVAMPGRWQSHVHGDRKCVEDRRWACQRMILQSGRAFWSLAMPASVTFVPRRSKYVSSLSPSSCSRLASLFAGREGIHELPLRRNNLPEQIPQPLWAWWYVPGKGVRSISGFQSGTSTSPPTPKSSQSPPFALLAFFISTANQLLRHSDDDHQHEQRPDTELEPPSKD